MQRTESLGGITKYAELCDGRVVDVERAEDDARGDGHGIGGIESVERELEHPRLAATNEDIADELGVLGRESAFFCVEKSAARDGGELEAGGEFDFCKRTREAEAESRGIVTFEFHESFDELRVRGVAQRGPRLFGGADSEDPRQFRHRFKRRTGVAREDEFAHDACGAIFLGVRKAAL